MANKKKEKPRHLGRGLASLLGPITSGADVENQAIPITAIAAKLPPDNELHSSLREIRIDSIKPNPYQPRMIWDEQELADLAESIRTNGVIQPIIVRLAESGFELIAGERRFRAAKMAGLETIPALVREANDEKMLELALIENIHRTSLNPIERAKAYQNYLKTFSLTQAKAAERLSEDRSAIANYLRILDLPEDIKQMLINRQLTMGHARAILSLPTDELRRKLANRAMAGRLSVRDVEGLVRKYMTGSSKAEKVKLPKPPHILDLEDKLTGQLGTKVAIETRKNGHRGKIIIEFYTLDEFDRIAEHIGLTETETV